MQDLIMMWNIFKGRSGAELAESIGTTLALLCAIPGVGVFALLLSCIV